MSDDYVKPEDEPEGHVTEDDLVPGDDVPEAPEDFGHGPSGDETSEDVDERLADDDEDDDDEDNETA